MPNITISIDEDVKKIISKRADKNLLTLREQLESIVRQSAVRTKSQPSTPDSKIDDRLVEIFSRSARGKKSAKEFKLKSKNPAINSIPDKDKIIVRKNKVVSSCSKPLKKLVEKAVTQAENFFKGKVDFEILLLEKRKQMDKICSSFSKKPEKTEDWLVGITFNHHTIAIFKQEVYEQVSPHKKESFFSTLVHEIAHIFVKTKFNAKIPNWLDEGLAYVVAEQDLKPLKLKQDLNQAFTTQGWMKTHPYLTSGKFTRFLIETYGKDNLFSLMKSLKNWKTRQDFSKIFQKVLGDNFDEVWKKWGEKVSQTEYL